MELSNKQRLGWQVSQDSDKLNNINLSCEAEHKYKSDFLTSKIRLSKSCSLPDDYSSSSSDKNSSSSIKCKPAKAELEIVLKKQT